MRLHIELDDEIVRAIDEVSGHRGRSRFIRDAIESALRHHSQRELLSAARGSISAVGHDWDEDPSAWVRRQRRLDRRSVG
jgi:metal-responsive CopG/Arc/MetJ family transcriptional regulator